MIWSLLCPCFFHRKLCLWESKLSLHSIIVHLILLLWNTLLCEKETIFKKTYVDFWAVFSVLHITNSIIIKSCQYENSNNFFYKHIHKSVLGICLWRSEIAVRTMQASSLVNSVNQFYKIVIQIQIYTYTSSMRELIALYSYLAL